jgi:hypothetical protein
VDGSLDETVEELVTVLELVTELELAEEVELATEVELVEVVEAAAELELEVLEVLRNWYISSLPPPSRE